MPEEFDAALLEQLTKEGRVYVDYPRVINKDAYKREVLDYVQAIDEFAVEKWKGKIKRLWQTIADDVRFKDDLSMKRGPQTGHINRYAVTNIVCRLQNKGVYQQDVPMLTLHQRLEGVTRKNKYYMSCGNYLLSDDAKRLLNKYVQEV